MKTSNFTFRMTEEEKNELKQICEKKDIPISQFVREAIRKYIQEVK